MAVRGSRLTSAGVRCRAARAVGFLGRHYHYPGQRALSVAARLLNRFPPPGELRYNDIDGHVRRADLRDHMESRAFVGRERLPKSVIAMVRPGDWTLDVGGNIGVVTGQLCRAVGPAGRVWVFEPVPRNVARLRELGQDNRLDQLEVFPCALSSTKGTAEIALPNDGFSGHASFTASWINAGRLEVATERLDDLTADVDDSEPLRLLKLDVEGFEREVLEGAEETLRRFRPQIYCEFNDIILRDAGSSSDALLRAFSDLGYRVAGGWSHKSSQLSGRNVDLLMTPDG